MLQSEYEKLDAYQKAAADTAVYPSCNSWLGKRNLFYVGLGLIGESLEAEQSPGDIDELGDVLWYTAMLCHELDFRLSSIAILGLERACDRGETQGHLLQIAAGVAEPLKKLWRDRDLKHLSAVKLTLADLVAQIKATADAQPSISGIEAVCDRNLAKLASRKTRGVLHGDGSHR